MPTFGSTYFKGVLLDAFDLDTTYAAVGTLVRNADDGSFWYSTSGTVPSWQPIGGGGSGVQAFQEGGILLDEMGSYVVPHGLSGTPTIYMVVSQGGLNGVEPDPAFAVPYFYNISADITNVYFDVAWTPGVEFPSYYGGYAYVYASYGTT